MGKDRERNGMKFLEGSGSSARLDIRVPKGREVERTALYRL